MKNYLLIDGNYYAHRIIHGIRIGDKNFNLSTPQQRANFVSSLNSGVHNLFASFNNDYQKLMDNFVFVFDHKSWRKDIPGFRPYYIDELSTENIEYKGNRDALKADSEIDFDAFDLCLAQFHDNIESLICSFKVEGCEGDDSLLLLSSALIDKNISVTFLCTDGDLEQIVKNHVMMFKNVKSKEFPNGKFIISNPEFQQLYSTLSDLERMTQNNSDATYKKTLFNFAYNGGVTRSNIIRDNSNGVEFASPVLTGLIKVICGDKKDNVFPLFRWSKPGSNSNFKVTEKMIEKVLGIIGLKFDEKSAIAVINDKSILASLLMNLRALTKQTCEPQKLLDHFKHNMKIIMLRKEFLPDNVKAKFQIKFNELEERLMMDLTKSDLLSLNLNTTLTDNAKDLILTSVPTGVGAINPDIQKYVPTGNSDIDDILGGL